MVEPHAHRRTFLIEAAPEHDVLLRILAPFAVQGAQILLLEAVQDQDRTCVRIEAGGVGPDLAERLAEKLRALPVVIAVGLGWRAAALAA